MGKKHNISFENIYLTGFPLDNCEARTLTLDNICDIQTILVYDYEDGKPWHDYTCVMEIIFFGYHDNIENDRIRICYDHPATLLAQFSEIMLGNDLSRFACLQPSCSATVKMDLKCNLGHLDYEKVGIKTEDFDEFNCKIRHKKRFYPTNPEMPDD